MVAAVFLGLLLLQASGPQTVPPKPARTSASAIKAESEAHGRGKKLLEVSEAEIAAIREPGMRAYAALQLARAYATFDRAKALDLLDQAFNSAMALPEDSRSRPPLEQQVLDAMAALDPEHADGLLAQAPAEVQRAALLAMLDYYQGQKQMGRAVEMIARIASDGLFPFAAASKVMEALPPENAAEREQIFISALTAFREQKESSRAFSSGSGNDFGDLIYRNWQTLPPALVRDAIGAVLKQAEAGDGESHELTMFGGKGSLAFNSAYEWRLFQLVPVLRRIDESAAEDLLKKNQSVQEQLQRFPQGPQSWSGAPDQPSVNGVVHTERDSSQPRTGSPAPPARAVRLLAMVEEMNRVLREVPEHSQQALTQALAISDDSTRVRTLMLVARSTRKRNLTVCKSALAKVVDQAERMPALKDQISELVEAGRLYREINEPDSVKQVVEHGGALAQKLYKADEDSEDSEKVGKAFWPSTQAWTDLAGVVAGVSPDVAIKLVNEIPDDEIRPAVRTVLAKAYLETK